MNYHSISDFRSDHEDLLDNLLTQSVAVLAKTGIITLEKISQDGMRVRASAGSSSFRRESTIKDQLELAKLLVEDIKNEEKKDPGACKRRLKASEKRVAENRQKKLEEACKNLEIVRNQKVNYAKKNRKKLSEKELNDVRISTTDPEARKLKMACGGYRPAYNVQFATSNVGKAIVGVDITNNGSDNSELLKMINQLERRFSTIPKAILADAGYRSLEEIDRVFKKSEACKLYMPIEEKRTNKNPFEKRPGDSDAVAEWRERMGTEIAKELYKERSATAEFSNALARNRGLQQFYVRGISKVKCVALWFAIAHNMMIIINNVL